MKNNSNKKPSPTTSEHTKPESGQNEKMNPTVSSEATETNTGSNAPTPPPTPATAEDAGAVEVKSVPSVEKAHEVTQPDCSPEETPSTPNAGPLEQPSAPEGSNDQATGNHSDQSDGNQDQTDDEDQNPQGCGTCPKPDLVNWAQRKVFTWPGKDEGSPCPWETMNGKPVIYHRVKTVLNLENSEFHEKLLCDGLTFNLGYACGFTCRYCYVEAVIYKLVDRQLRKFNRQHCTKFDFPDVVIRRKEALTVLRAQLLNPDGSPKFMDPDDRRVIYSSTLVDPASNNELLQETADACNLILEHTNWQIRLLSKSALLKNLIAKELIPKKYHNRLILGFSIGTLNDNIARAIESGTSSPRARIKALHWLQDHGIRTFGMICPSLPQEDYDKFSKEICEAIRVEKCEHIWAEIINVRGENRDKTIEALKLAGLTTQAELMESVFLGKGAKALWETYARATFEAHQKNVPAEKLRFLQYVDGNSAQWWADRRKDGAVPLGKFAQTHMLLAGGESAPSAALRDLTDADIQYLKKREDLVHAGVRASIAASEAIFEIYSYENGLLWKKEFQKFEHYCHEKWGYARANAYRAKETGRFLADLQQFGSQLPDDAVPVKLPINAGQIRPLLEKVPKGKQVACWEQIVDKHDPSDLTGMIVEQLAREFVQKAGTTKSKPATSNNAGTKTAKKEAQKRQRALDSLDRLGDLLEDLPEPQRFEQLIQGLRLLIIPSNDGQAVEVEAEVIAETTTEGTNTPESKVA
jgi:DNA repair photolyase